MSRFTLKIVFWSVLGGVPGGLWGADGAILIDQNTAIDGGLIAGDAPGFPVTISQPGSYRLGGNLTVPDSGTTAIRITANSVTLDLNGFSIIGPACTGPAETCPAGGSGIGVQAGGEPPAPRGVRILNGFVRGMGGIGILVTGDGASVDRVTVQGNVGGGMSVAGTVTNSSATQNGSFGIIARTVRDSIARENLGDGIILDGDGGGVATGNVSSLNGGYGISASFSTVSNNTLFLNKSFGISSFCPASITGNTITRNSDAGNIDTHGEGCVLMNNALRP